MIQNTYRIILYKNRMNLRRSLKSPVQKLSIQSPLSPIIKEDCIQAKQRRRFSERICFENGFFRVNSPSKRNLPNTKTLKSKKGHDRTKSSLPPIIMLIYFNINRNPNKFSQQKYIKGYEVNYKG